MQKSGSFASRRRGILMVIADVILWRTEMKLRAAILIWATIAFVTASAQTGTTSSQSKPATTTYALLCGHVFDGKRSQVSGQVHLEVRRHRLEPISEEFRELARDTRE